MVSVIYTYKLQYPLSQNKSNLCELSRPEQMQRISVPCMQIQYVYVNKSQTDAFCIHPAVTAYRFFIIERFRLFLGQCTYTVQNVIDFPRYNTKCSGENQILCEQFRAASRFPLHSVLYLGNFDYFLDSVSREERMETKRQRQLESMGL